MRVQKPLKALCAILNLSGKSQAAQAFSSRSNAGLESAQRLQEAITPEVAQSLVEDGYAVVDNVFGPHTSESLLNEIKEVKAAGLMQRNQTHFVKSGERSLLEKASIFEGDLLQKETLDAAPQFAHLQQDTGFRTMLSLFLPQLRLDAQAIKLQVNAGSGCPGQVLLLLKALLMEAGMGGCFPIHLDSDETVDSRRVTAIMYLNRDWKRQSGGQLRLYPSWSQFLDIEPINDRLVLFSSCRMPHRVLPSEAERYCFTIWLSQTRGGSGNPRNLSALLKELESKGSGHAATLLSEPEVRKALTKLAFAEEWASSLRDSHPETDARTAVLANFERERELLQQALSKAFPESGLTSGELPLYQRSRTWL